MEYIGAKDRPDSGILLILLKITFLNSVIQLFIKGISDLDIKKEVVRGLGSSIRLFYSIYSLAEEAKQTRIKVIKLVDMETKEK